MTYCFKGLCLGVSNIDKSLSRERIIVSQNRNFSLVLENLIASSSLSTLDFCVLQDTFLFLLSIFESLILKLSFFLSIFESSNREFNIIYSRWFKIDQPKSVPEV